MTTRAQFYANKKHDQRTFGAVRPAKPTPEQATAWIPGFLETLAHGQEIRLDDETARTLGDRSTQEVRLRDLSRRGMLHMTAERGEAQEFLGWLWVADGI